MTPIALAIVLGFLMLILLKGPGLNAFGALVCTLFGVALSLTPMGPEIHNMVGATADWLWQSGRSL